MFIEKEMNLPTLQQEKKEMELYYKFKISDFLNPKFTDISEVINRKIKCWIEELYNLPQNIFYIEYDNYIFVGRKLISQLKLSGKIKELNCSAISSSMILGVLNKDNKTEDKVCVYYHPLHFSEKLYIFNKIKNEKNLDLYYPFQYIDKTTKMERTSPDLGWSLNIMRVANLGAGEEFIRKYTIGFLKQFNMDGKVVYDPACSTGQFLNTIKCAFPNCYTIGQDLSLQMVDYAKDFVDEIYCGDAYYSPILLESVDFIFFRFINSEVVSKKRAYELFEEIIKRVKIGGYIVVFGHTPVLVYKKFFLELNLKILQTLAYDESIDCIFQYYVLQR